MPNAFAMKILFVAGVVSIHVVRWIAQLVCTHWDVHIVDPKQPYQLGDV